MTSPHTNGNNGSGNGNGKRSAARWPDLLIGLLVLLLLGGFGVLLFGQRSANTAAPATTPTATTPPATESAEIPAAPGTATITPAPAPANTDPATTDPAPAEAQTEIPPATEPSAEQATQQPTEQPTEQAQTPETAPTATAPTATPPVTPTTPGAGTTTPTTPLNDIPTIVAAPVEAAPVGAAPAAQPSAPATTDPAPATVPPVSPAAQTGGAVATSETRTPLRSDYRISLGTFSSEATANSRTAGVSGLGYRVYPIDLGSEVVAQIGPFADEATARQALADVQRAYPGAILYPPRNRSLTGGTVSGDSPASTTSSNLAPESNAPSAAATPTPTPATPAPQAAAPAPSGPVYLQVGAFDRVEGAQNLVGTLREQGFAPTVNAPEGRKVTVLVGPFSGDALTRAEERLTSSGLDSFRVR